MSVEEGLISGRLTLLRERPAYIVPVVLAASLFVLPFVTTRYVHSIVIIANIFAIYAMAWDILSGYTGYMNFGPSFFVGAGAYVVGILTVNFGVPVYVAIPAAFVVSIVTGLIVAYPSLRTSGVYFTLITILLPLLGLKFVTIFSGYTGGRLGLQGLPLLSVMESYYLSVVFMIVTFLALYWLAASDFGLVLRSIKANELAVASAAINPTKFKVGAFVVSALFSSLGGIIYAFYVGIVAPSTTIDLHISIVLIIAAVIGGTGTIYGAIGGAYFFIVARELLSPLGDIRFAFLYAFALVVVLIFPKGLTRFAWERTKEIVEGDADD
ncbi:branched-chain amino acid ABC transporter permease [Natrinema sp. 1APR25-10V2]|uniref:branched-chain amino acid ABC transporter permease n=1 Tax=Natrinema sp. 1APR25-10V2 TaxID=2951081 RepID=UPI002875F930|nr:branched-chain amino acid ABC transporter permease [Natrinema sp. 1APR25-10V2]MDS0475878.1 branched-chain amino acid ABC transporter permease [Natrinema sp. 1APR25-10V2]